MSEYYLLAFAEMRAVHWLSVYAAMVLYGLVLCWRHAEREVKSEARIAELEDDNSQLKIENDTFRHLLRHERQAREKGGGE